MMNPARKAEPATSRVHKRIRLKDHDQGTAQAIASEMKTSSVVARILAARGFKPDKDLEDYLLPTLKNGLPEPKGLRNLGAAATLIADVHRAGGSIAICCDFDVDGLSGGSVVHDLMKTAGISSRVFVPNRFVDGYGLNENTVREIAAQGFKLLLTIDFGTTNAKEILIAKALGLKTIVLDHHHITGELPPADVFINPHQPGCGFAGGVACAAGLAWYLALALTRELKPPGVDPRTYLDLACLGTICDMVPLIGLNRVIAKKGLEQLSDSKRPGLRSLRNVIGVRGNVECSHVSFGIGPRLNAAGRIEHGELVIELLTTRDSNRADKLARDLNDLNSSRQDIETSVKEEAIKIVEQRGGPDWGIVVGKPEFHTGVIGIVAQRLVEHFYRPSAVMGMDSPGIFKGSVRGIKGFSVIETLSACAEHLMKFGGHQGAGGFSVKEGNLAAFSAAFVAECKKRLKDIEIVPYVDADTETTLDEITVGLVNELAGMAPFGMGNPAPLVLVKNLRVVQVKELKGAHLKALFSDGKRFISGVMWRQPSHPALHPEATVDIVCRPEVSTFNGNVELQANLQAVQQSSR